MKLLLISFFLFIHFATFAQSENKPDSSKTVECTTVYSKKWEDNSKELPNYITKVTQEQISIYQPQTAADMLQNTGEVFMQRSQAAGGSPMIRGFAANRLLIIVDGVRMNNAIYRSGNLHNILSVDPLSLESAEIIHGAGSLQYGSDALGGVMDFHIMDPKIGYTQKWTVQPKVGVRVNSANNEIATHVNLKLSKGKFGYAGGFTRQQFGDITMGSRNQVENYLRPDYVSRINNRDSIIINSNPLVQKGSSFQMLSTFHKLRFQISDKISTNLSVYHSTTSNFDRYDRLIERRNNRLRFAEWYYGPQSFSMFSSNTSIMAKKSWADEIRIIVGYQNYGESRHSRSFNSNQLINQIEKVKQSSISVDLDRKFNSKHHLFYGFEGYHNLVNSVANSQNINDFTTIDIVPRYPEATTLNSSAYAMMKSYITDKWIFTYGFRYSLGLLRSQFDTVLFKLPFDKADLNTSAPTGSIGFVYQHSQNLEWVSNFSTGFRIPNVDDVGKIFESEPGSLVIPNNKLQPEYVYSIDMGFRFKSKKIEWQTSIFGSFLNNAMARRFTKFNGLDSIVFLGEKSAVQSIQNVDYAYIYGLNTNIKYHLNTYFYISSTLNFTYGRETEQEGDFLPARHSPPIFGLSSLTFKKSKEAIVFNIMYCGEVSYEKLALSERNKKAIYAIDALGNPYSPAWYTLNLIANTTRIKNFSMGLFFNNLLDRQYKTYSSGVAAPGFNMGLSINYSFNS
jgi:hemoglobin/transferrin/lactoferrin receptor protein